MDLYYDSLAYTPSTLPGIGVLASALLLAILAWLRGPTPFIWFSAIGLTLLVIFAEVSVLQATTAALVTILGWFIARDVGVSVRAKRRQKAAEAQGIPERGGEPDAPANFSAQAQWIAVRTTSTREVAQTLSLQDAEATNWQRGVAWSRYFKPVVEGEAQTPCFISAEVDGWVFVLLARPTASRREAMSLLGPLSKQFGEAQYFLRPPGRKGVYGWDLACDGKLVRSLRQTLRGGFNTLGDPTQIERDLLKPDRLDRPRPFPPIDTPIAAVLFAIADEEPSAAWPDLPLKVAADWSVDPTNWPQTDTEPQWLGLAGYIDMTPVPTAG